MVGHGLIGAVGPHRALQLGWINLLAVCPFHEVDHATGLIKVLEHEDFTFFDLWMNRPWDYVDDVIDSFHGAYRRNLYALKWPALVLNGLIVVGCAVQLRYGWSAQAALDVYPVLVIAFLHATYLAIFSTRSAVEEASRTYARQLLLSINSPALAKIAPISKSRAKGKKGGAGDAKASDSRASAS